MDEYHLIVMTVSVINIHGCVNVCFIDSEVTIKEKWCPSADRITGRIQFMCEEMMMTMRIRFMITKGKGKDNFSQRLRYLRTKLA